MSTDSTKRKMAAILSADVKGYSRLMSADEEGTVKSLNNCREIISRCVHDHNGRVVDSPGDNVLAEFASTVEAVKCAVKIQENLKTKNADLPESRRMEFRIGVNLGDVIEEEGRIYGDGVNIAARLEGLAEGGGICVSGTAFDQVKNKVSVGYQYLGKQTVKNIPDPVRAYKVLMESEAAGKVIGERGWKERRWHWAAAAAVVLVGAGLTLWNFYFRPPPFEPASKEKMAFPLPDKPSIAVLPFDNISGDRQQDYLADGITENIISYLAKHPAMFVIDRKSTFTYKGKHAKVQQVSEDLGVRYILEGSVQKSGNKLRVTAQLVDALKGHQLWTGRYDRDFQDLFALQDDITVNVLKAMGVQLTGRQIAFQYDTTNIEAWGLAVKGNSLSAQGMKETNLEARALLEKAVKFDPSYAFAWNGLAWTYIAEAWFGWSDSRVESLKRAMELAQKQEATGKSGGALHTTMNVIYMFQGKYEEAIAEGEKAVAMEPNEANHYARLATTFRIAGRPNDSIANVMKAMRLNPYYPAWYLFDLGGAYEMTGQYNEALTIYIRLLERSLKGESNPLLVHQWLVITYARLGQIEKAGAHAENILKLNPKYTVEFFRKSTPYKDQTYLDGLVSLLIKAGLPEKAPLPLPDKPSIAVLPFVNMSDDPQQEYFSDGMTEDLITDLSKISGLFVIARNSTFVYKGKAVNIQQISRELGVKYVLEGSVRRAGEQVRINAQLIDATTGQHLWAERYDGIMRDIFSLQDKINQKIVAALAVKLTTEEKTLVTQKGTNDPAAYEKFLKGREHYLRNTKEDFAKAEVCFKKAIELDPNFSRAKASVALLYFDAASQGVRMREAFKISDVETRLRARNYLTAAMKKPTSIAYQVEGLMDLSLRQHSEALSQIENALALDPNDPSIHSSMSWVLSMSGRPAEGMEYARSGMRLDPNNPARYLTRIGIAHFCMGEYEEAATAIERALKQNPEIFREGTILASAYAHLGRNEEAKAACQTYAYRPHFHIYYWPFKDRGVANSFLKGLLKAGVEESRIEMAKDYLFTKDEQLTGDDLRAFYYPSTTAGYSLQGLDWSLEIAKDGNVTIRSPEAPGGMDKGRSWLEGDKLWLQFQNYNHGIAYCSTTFRNPTGTFEGKNQYISFNDVWYSRFSRTQ